MISPCVPVKSPSQEFGREKRGDPAAEQLGGEIEKLGAQVADNESQDVGEDDVDGGEFGRQVPPQADEDGHQHGQGSQKQAVRQSQQGTDDGHDHMKGRESVNQV